MRRSTVQSLSPLLVFPGRSYHYLNGLRMWRRMGIDKEELKGSLDGKEMLTKYDTFMREINR